MKNILYSLLFICIANTIAFAQDAINFKTSNAIKARATASKALFTVQKDATHYIVGLSEEIMKSGMSVTKNIGEEPNTKKENIVLAQIDISTNELSLIRKYEINDDLENSNFLLSQASEQKAFVLMYQEEEGMSQVYLLTLDLNGESVATKKIFSANTKNGTLICRNFRNAQKLVLQFKDKKKKELSSLVIDVKNNIVGEKTVYPYALDNGEKIVEFLPQASGEGGYIITQKNNNVDKKFIEKLLNPFDWSEQYYFINKEGVKKINLDNSRKYSSGASFFYNNDAVVHLLVPSGDEKQGIQDLVLASFDKESIAKQSTIAIAYENANSKINFKTFSVSQEGNTLSQVSDVQCTKDGQIVIFMEQKRITEWIDLDDRKNDSTEMSYGPGLQIVCDQTGKKVDEDIVKYYNKLKFMTDDKGYGLDYVYGKNKHIYFAANDGISSSAPNQGQYKIGKLKEQNKVVSFKSRMNDNFLINENLVIIPRLVFGGKLKLEYFVIE